MPQQLCSMTGFGAGRRKAEAIQIRVEVRSVNHRYLKIASRVPDELAWSQHRVEQRIRERVERGSISLTLTVELEGGHEPPSIDEARLEQLWATLTAFRDRVAPEGVLSLTELLQVPGLVKAENPISDPTGLLPLIEGAVDDAVEALREMQAAEGAHLREELAQITSGLRAAMEAIEEVLPGLAVENRDRFRARVQELLRDLDVEIDSGELWRECAILAEKADVTEEVGRLRGHLDQFTKLVQEGGRIGRRLDFLTQEMFREANTMTAKLNRYEISERVVEAKAEIDRLREQVQNIE